VSKGLSILTILFLLLCLLVHPSYAQAISPKPVSANQASAVVIPSPNTPNQAISPAVSTFNPIFSPPISTPNLSSTPNLLATPNSMATNNMLTIPTPTPTLKPTPNPQIQKDDTYLYSFPSLESFRYPPRPRNKYPDLDIAGFFEGKFSGRDYSPKTATGSMLQTIRSDPIYNKLPRDVLLGSPKLDIRYKVNIDGKLSEDLSVHYDVEQEPDFPGKYDIQVKYKKSTLSFHFLDANFQNGDFINVKKSLNGAKFESYDDNWEFIVASGKQRSDPKKIENWGSGSNIVRVGHANLLEGSIQVWINNIKKEEGRDYTVNYYEGKLTFNEPIKITDYYEIIYEFTNPIADFIPILSKKNFLGTQFKWQTQGKAIVTLLSNSSTEFFSIPSANLSSSPNALFIPNNSEISNVFYLQHYPIVLSSITVELNGHALKNIEEYSLRALTGKLKILNTTLKPGDQLRVSYKYYLTEKIEEDIIGQDSFGPYYLSHKNIVRETVSINVGTRPAVEAEDYFLDYETGKLDFNYHINYPEIISVKYTTIKSTSTTPDIKSSPLRFGISYLNEYARAKPEQMEINVPSTNYTVSHNYFFLDHSPLISTQDISIVINNLPAQYGTDYTANLYTGRIDFLTPTTATTVTVKYTYRKSLVASHIFYGKIGAGEHTQYVNGIDFELLDTPVKYKGIKEIELNDPTHGLLALAQDEEFIVDYGPDGQEIKITFILQDPDNHSDLLFIPKQNTKITLRYEYTPASDPDIGNVNQHLVGLTFGANLTDQWSVYSDVAAADQNFTKPIQTLEEPYSVSGNGIANHIYTLPNKDIVENSETIYIQQANGITKILTKDIDYSLNYMTGNLKFLHLVPKALDRIYARYKYYDASGTSSIGESQQFKFATKLGATFQSDNLLFENSYKAIDKDYQSLAPIKDQNGSAIYNSHALWHISSKEMLDIRYQNRKTLANRALDLNLTTNELQTNSTLYLLNDIFKTDFSGRFTESIQDKQEVTDPTNPTHSSTLHAVDSRQQDYTAEVSFGPEFFKSSVKQTYSLTNKDFLDNTNPQNSEVSSTLIKSTLDLKNFYFFGNFQLSPYYYSSHLFSTSIDSSQPVSANSSKSSLTTTEKSIQAKITPFSALQSGFDYSLRENASQPSTQATANIDSVENLHYSVRYSPFSWFNALFDKRKTQDANKVSYQLGNIEESDQFKINRFSLGGALLYCGLSQSTPFIQELNRSYFTYSQNKKNQSKNSDRETFAYDNYAYSFQNFQPIRGIQFLPIQYSESSSTRENYVQTSTSSQNNTITSRFSTSYGLKVNPRISILNRFTYHYSFSETKDNSTSTKIAVPTSNIVSTERTQKAFSQTLTFKSTHLILPFFFNQKIHFGKLGASYKNILNLNDNIAIDASSSQPDLSKTQILSNRTEKNSDNNHDYTANFSPFNLIPFTGTYSSKYDTRRSNLLGSTTPFRITLSNEFQISTHVSPLSFLQLSGSFRHSNKENYLSPSLNITEDALLQAKDPYNSQTLSEYLHPQETQKSISATLKPLSFLSITARASFLEKLEIIKNASTPSTANFTQNTGTLGSTLTPLKGLTISYFYSNHFSTDPLGNQHEGFSSETRVDYSPLVEENYKVSISYSHVHQGGKNFNNLDQEQSEQSGDGLIKSSIQETNNTVQKGSLNINIVFKLDQNPFVDRFELFGEGYLKNIENPLNPLTEYDISGLLIKGTLFF
jgi:hypothetical protein